MSNKHVPNVLDPFSEPYSSHEERTAYADGLRALAQWVEETSFPIPSIAISRFKCDRELSVYSPWIDDESFVERAGSAARLIGGKVKKGESYAGGPFTLTRDFGGNVTFLYSISREAVCEKVVEDVLEDRYVPVDEEAALDLECRIDDLKSRLDELPKEVRSVPTTRTTYRCPESLLVKSDEREETT